MDMPMAIAIQMSYELERTLNDLQISMLEYRTSNFLYRPQLSTITIKPWQMTCPNIC